MKSNWMRLAEWWWRWRIRRAIRQSANAMERLAESAVRSSEAISAFSTVASAALNGG